MAQINSASIEAKLKKYMSSSSFQKQVTQKLDDFFLNGIRTEKSQMFSMDEYADKFIDIMVREVNASAGFIASNGELGPTAVHALINLRKGKPRRRKHRGKRYEYEIPVSYAGDMHRESLTPTLYSGVTNIAALLNNGYSASAFVYGKWHGDDTMSIRYRNGAHFIERALRTMNGYKGVNVEVDDIYTIA